MKKLHVPIQEIQCFTGFIDYIINQLYQTLLYQGVNLFAIDEFKSFYYIKENAQSDISYFLNLVFEEDTMGFIPVKRNIRISSEALLDLYNLVYAEDYKTVLLYMENSHNFNFSKKFEKYCHKGDFTILSKLKIAKDNQFDGELDFLKKGLLSETNKYIHASIFVQPNSFDYNSKLNDAKNMMQIELDIYQMAMKILCGKYNFNFENYTCQIPSYSDVTYLTFEQVYLDCSEKIQIMDLIDMQNPYSFMGNNGGM